LILSHRQNRSARQNPIVEIERDAGLDALAGAPLRRADHARGETIDHIDGVMIEKARHHIAPRLYQNTARARFNLFREGDGRVGRRLVDGGHFISLARLCEKRQKTLG
jgi:hypothetical protein